MPEAKRSRAPRPFDYEPAPSPERPGLATVWGETVSSPTRSTPFTRESASPFATATLYYNDGDGLNAMLRSGDRARDPSMALASNFRVRLLDESGRALPSGWSGGRFYTLGNEGQRYIIQISNQSGERVEAVATVDGLDVIDGQPGSLDKRGYLVNPWSTLEIDGFRRSENAVAAFRFGKVKESYAASKGDARNVGVIGIALFRERGATAWSDSEVELRHSADPFPGRFATPPPSRPVY